MPTYEYECEACRHHFDAFQSMTDKVLKTCPKCKKRKLVRLIGAGAGLVFKGSGFYITDYKKGGGKPPAASSSGGERSGESPAPAKSGESSGSGDTPKSDTGGGKAGKGAKGETH